MNSLLVLCFLATFIKGVESKIDPLIKCEANRVSIQVTIPPSMNVDAGSLIVGFDNAKSNCEHESVTGNDITFSFGMNECDPDVETINGKVVFTYMIGRNMQKFKGLINREDKLSVTASCSFKKQFELSTSFTNDVKTEHIKSSEESTLPVSLGLFVGDKAYTGGPLEVGTEIVAKITTPDFSDDVVYSLVDFFAKPSDKSDPISYYFYKQGCKQTDSTLTTEIKKGAISLKFRTFSFTHTDAKEVVLNAKVTLCTKDAMEDCSPKDCSAGSAPAPAVATPVSAPATST